MATITAIIKTDGLYKDQPLLIDTSNLYVDKKLTGAYPYVRILYYSDQYKLFKNKYGKGIFVVGTRFKDGKKFQSETNATDIYKDGTLEKIMNSQFKDELVIPPLIIDDDKIEKYISPQNNIEWDWLDNIAIIILIIMVAWLLGKSTNPNVYKIDYK